VWVDHAPRSGRGCAAAGSAGGGALLLASLGVLALARRRQTR
jgi:MYXO-CTERM domain-containing protein